LAFSGSNCEILKKDLVIAEKLTLSLIIEDKIIKAY